MSSPRSPTSLSSPQSPRLQCKVKGSPVKSDRGSNSPKDGRPNKGGAGGKGTWGGLLEDSNALDPNDPNYDSSKEPENLNSNQENRDLDEYKKKSTIIIEEYFSTNDIVSVADELRELGKPSYSFYFVKKLTSIAMDRPDNEKEMAAVLLSALYADIIEPPQVRKGFRKLLESADDLIVDTPDTVDVLSLFIARAVVDEILPPAFLTKQMGSLSEDSKGFEVLEKAQKGYLSAPHHAEVIERRWASKSKSVENLKGKIVNLLDEYVMSGDKKEAFRCMKDLKVPFFHHEIVKRALVIAMEKPQAEGLLLDLLKQVFEPDLINSTQISKGFSRMIDSVDDLSLDVPNARIKLQSLIAKAASEGWLCASILKPLDPEKGLIKDTVVKAFKAKAQCVVQEYFLSGDISEVISCLGTEDSAYSDQLNPIFLKKLITLAMDRKNREKEMASVLISSLCFPSEDVVSGFSFLIEAAEDTSLDNPVVVEDLALFLARAVVDEALAPQQLEEIGTRCFVSGPDPVGSKVLQMAKSLLKAPLSGERILRCWGGGGNNSPGWAVEDVKENITRLLEEFQSGGEIREAYRCIKELGMPFFHHEVVKKGVVIVIEKRSDRMWNLLGRCFDSCLITTNQMMKGFGRVAECLDDLALDVPDAEKQFLICIEKAKVAGWLDNSFTYRKSASASENGIKPLKELRFIYLLFKEQKKT